MRSRTGWPNRKIERLFGRIDDKRRHRDKNDGDDRDGGENNAV